MGGCNFWTRILIFIHFQRCSFKCFDLVRMHVQSQRENRLRDSLGKLLLSTKQGIYISWRWLQFPSWSKGSVPSSHAKGQWFEPWSRQHLFQLMDIEQPSLYNCYFVESCQTSPSKRENQNFGIVIRLFMSYLFVCDGLGTVWSIMFRKRTKMSFLIE